MFRPIGLPLGTFGVLLFLRLTPGVGHGAQFVGNSFSYLFSDALALVYWPRCNEGAEVLRRRAEEDGLDGERERKETKPISVDKCGTLSH